MRLVMSILLVLIGLLVGLQLAAGQTSELPPFPDVDKSLPYAVDDMGNTNAIPVYPFLLCTGVDTNGRPILEAPPQWMLDGPKTNAPSIIPLKLETKGSLTNADWSKVSFVVGIYAEEEQQFYRIQIGE